ncbi:MAG: hypothetical protein D6705_06410 [Deltaproteobacteria bacterium]|nr:MAG: hypothetical protein D6705_06410 [Deltaproteobacteria bacterium]
MLEILASALERGASRVVFETGQPPLVEFAEGMEPMGSEISEDALFEAVSSVADEDRMADLALGNVVEIEVVVGGHGVRFSADPRPDGIVVTAVPLDAARPRPKAAAAGADASSAAFAAERLGDEDSTPPAAPGTSGSWLPLDLDVDTGEIDLGEGEPDGEGSDHAFPSGLSDGVGKVQTTPSSDALPRVGADAGVADVAVAPTRGDVPVVGHEHAGQKGADDGRAPSAGDTARDVPPVAGTPDPIAAARAAVGGAEVAVPPAQSSEEPAADLGAVSPEPWADPSLAAPAFSESALEAPTSFAEATLEARSQADEVDSPDGEPAERTAERMTGLVGVGEARVSDVDVAAVATRFAELAAAVEPGRLVFLRPPLGAPGGLVRAMADALVAERGGRAFVVDDGIDAASWRRMERVIVRGDVVFVDLVDPAARAIDVLRLAESDAVVLLITRARAPDGARRILAGGVSTGAVVDWIEALGTAWIAYTDGDWQFS